MQYHKLIYFAAYIRVKHIWLAIHSALYILPNIITSMLSSLAQCSNTALCIFCIGFWKYSQPHHFYD